ncbi:hypothetical protein H2200_006464 [Cladophialophora chaetospira]|uniref:GST N-terminal domain-containing protein n=1 Tax=Cladophialophora chaetospira TaxID=386627 RepID=A0AA38X891_9EURO|nr:hypothetical protein H2200_006464 [Cladophialophora chaetospira]
MSDEVVLFDLPSKGGHAWSLNPLKTRLFLNIKGIPYKTQWVEYPDLKPTFQKFGIPPNTSGPYEYTSPTVLLPSGEYVMDSRPIANKLESLHPTPSLHLDSPYLARMEEFLPKAVNAVRPVFMPLVPKVFLNTPSAEYFTKSREKSVGKSLDEYAQGKEQAFEDVKPFVKELGGWFAENSEGPFLLGKEVSYADVMVLGWLRMLDRLGVVDRIFEAEGGGKLKEAYEAAGKWFERETY